MILCTPRMIASYEDITAANQLKNSCIYDYLYSNMALASFFPHKTDIKR